MTRTERLLRLARLRGDRLAIATLETARTMAIVRSDDWTLTKAEWIAKWSEAELRAAWGDR